VPWITVTSGSSGSGNGSVNFRVDATTGPTRSGTLTIAGRTFTVNQGQGCTFSLSSTAATVDPAGGTGTFDVRTSNGCGWAAASGAPWITVTSGATGSGNGTVGFTAAANTGPARTGTITAAGQTFTITQNAGCTYSIAPLDQTVPSAGGAGSFAVTAAAGCAWTSTSNAPWISITAGAAGTGGGTVQFTAAANTGVARSGTISAAGQTFTVNQDSGCSATIAPDTIAEPSAGGQQNVAVTVRAARRGSRSPAARAAPATAPRSSTSRRTPAPRGPEPPPSPGSS
jgi:hypothetical protein